MELFVSYAYQEKYGNTGLGSIVLEREPPCTSDEVQDIMDFIIEDTDYLSVVLINWKVL
jgi:hypothetical protein